VSKLGTKNQDFDSKLNELDPHNADEISTPEDVKRHFDNYNPEMQGDTDDTDTILRSEFGDEFVDNAKT
jgi:hypothetical protein